MPAFATFSPNISLWNVTADPNGTDTAGRGSLALRTDSLSMWVNSDGATAWVPVLLGSGTTAFSAAVVWTLLDNTAAAFSVGATGDTDMMVFDTTNGAELIAIGATSGLRFNDSIPLRFGTPGTDVVFTPDGTNLAVTGTGFITYATTQTAFSVAHTLSLLDNSATALTFSSTGATDLLIIDTTNGAEKITFREAVLTQLHIANRAVADSAVDPGFFIRKTYLAGASTTDFALPARTGGWRVVDAYIHSGGATGGTVQVQTAAGAANVTDAMVPGNAGVITRCASLANQTFASGATVRLNIAAGAPAGEAFIRIEPL